MSSGCEYCTDGADMLGTTDGALAKLGAAMGLSHVIDDDRGERGCWRVELVSGFGDAPLPGALHSFSFGELDNRLSAAVSVSSWFSITQVPIGRS